MNEPRPIAEGLPVVDESPGENADYGYGYALRNDRIEQVEHVVEGCSGWVYAGAVVQRGPVHKSTYGSYLPCEVCRAGTRAVYLADLNHAKWALDPRAREVYRQAAGHYPRVPGVEAADDQGLRTDKDRGRENYPWLG